MDFTLNTYSGLLQSLKNFEYDFIGFCNYLNITASKKAIILRHDVDRLPGNSLKFARIEHEMGIKGTYYFRILPISFKEPIIRDIASMGHEIGYHYETMDTSHGDVDKAYDEFCRNLEIFRKFVPIETICMHGSPLSKFDNRAIWQKYNYRRLGIIGEPYFDLDFSRVLYLTDTGRRWDGERFSVRDKVQSSKLKIQNSETRIEKPETKNINSTFNIQHSTFHSTSDIITAANSRLLPDQIMMTFHPQRWSDRPLPWVKELVLQNVKNVVKRLIVKSEQ